MSSNRNALGTAQKAGFRIIGRIAYVMLFGFTIARIGRRWTCRHLAPGQKLESSIDATRFP